VLLCFQQHGGLLFLGNTLIIFVMKGLNKAYLCFVQDFISVKKPSHIVSRDGKTLQPVKQVKVDKKKK